MESREQSTQLKGLRLLGKWLFHVTVLVQLLLQIVSYLLVSYCRVSLLMCAYVSIRKPILAFDKPVINYCYILIVCVCG